MTDYIELPGGRLKEKPKSHIKGGLKPGDTRDDDVAEFKEKKIEVALDQEVSQADEEPDPLPKGLGGRNPRVPDPERTWSFPHVDSPHEMTGQHRFTGGELREDLNVRKQPEPGRFPPNNNPKPVR